MVDGELAPDEAGENEGVVELTTGVATRLVGHAIELLQAAALHPTRRAAALTGQKVDRRADAKRHGRGDLLLVLVYPQFLLGGSQADKQQVRPRRFDGLSELGVLPHVALHTNTLADDDVGVATPAVVGDKLLIRTSTRLYCVRKAADARLQAILGRAWW